jgi:hypothetical protein
MGNEAAGKGSRVYALVKSHKSLFWYLRHNKIAFCGSLALQYVLDAAQKIVDNSFNNSTMRII